MLNDSFLMLPLGLAFALAVIDWWAVRTERVRIESVAKPAVLIVMVIAVLTSGPTTAGYLIACGLFCSTIGDLLLLPAVDRFIGGLVAFLVGHLWFVAGFIIGTSEMSLVGLVLGSLLSIVVLVSIGGPIVSGAGRRDQRLVQPVRGYVGVLALMLIAGQATGALVAAAGATLFAASDAVLGWNRFVWPIRHGRFWTHIPYHLGQGLIALWAIGL